MATIEAAARRLVLRPLVTYDKNETIALARRIGTYDTVDPALRGLLLAVRAAAPRHRRPAWPTSSAPKPAWTWPPRRRRWPRRPRIRIGDGPLS